MRHNRIPPLTTDQLPFLSFGRRVIVKGTLLTALGDGSYQPVREAQLVDYRRYPTVVPNRWKDRRVIPAGGIQLSERQLMRN